jgi:hypothetical protein
MNLGGFDQRASSKQVKERNSNLETPLEMIPHN